MTLDPLRRLPGRPQPGFSPSNANGGPVLRRGGVQPSPDANLLPGSSGNLRAPRTEIRSPLPDTQPPRPRCPQTRSQRTRKTTSPTQSRGPQRRSTPIPARQGNLTENTPKPRPQRRRRLRPPARPIPTRRIPPPRSTDSATPSKPGIPRLSPWHLVEVSNASTEAVNNLIKRVRVRIPQLPNPGLPLRRQTQPEPTPTHTPLKIRRALKPREVSHNFGLLIAWLFFRLGAPPPSDRRPPRRFQF